MKAKLVKFHDNGMCKNDIDYLRRHPECGIRFIQDKPFRPHNHPTHKFRPHEREFDINTLNQPVPTKPNIPPTPPIGQPPKIGEAVGAPPYTNEYLPQDYTGKYGLDGRRILADTPHGHSVDEYIATKIVNAFNRSGYGAVPRMGNDSYSHETPERPTRPVGEVELEDFGAGVGINFQEPPPIRQTRIRPLADPRDTEFGELPREMNVTDLPPDIKEKILETLAEEGITERTRLEKVARSLENTIDELDREIQSSREPMRLRAQKNIKLSTLRRIQNDLNKIINKEKLTRRLLEGQPDKLKPRGMTDEELIDMQIEQLTRNSTQEEAKLIENQIKAQTRRTTLPKRKVPVPEIEGTELVAIEPEKEEVLIVREAERFTRKGRPQISQREAEQIANKFLEKGISRSRTLQILEEFGLYDTQGEFELQAISDPNERAWIRRMGAQRIIEAETRDTNLLPTRQEEIEVRPDTPLTRGRTDIAPGRSRVEKVYDRVAGKLPEEMRTLAGSVKRNAEAFNENVRTRSLEAIQRIQSTSTRIFGQKYASIRETATGVPRELEMGTITAPDGNINIRPPVTEDITGIRANDLQALDFDPLGSDYQETFVGGTRPKITYAERLQRVRAGALSSETGVAGAGAVGGVLIGFGVAELMGQAGVHNKYAIAAGAGGAGGAGARILTMAGSRALTRGTTTAVAETATYTAIRAGTSLLRGAAEGAVVGLALMPVDMLLNDAFVNAGMSHTGANLASGAIVGTTATAATTIALFSLGAAPETLGLSLVAGGVAMGVASVIGFVTGQDQDRKEKNARRESERIRNELNITASARQNLLATLPNYGYDFDRALDAFAYKDALGIDNSTWTTFSNNSRIMFVPRPSNNPPPTPTSGQPPTGEQKRINDLFSRYITNELINRVCTDGGCEELRRHDHGALTKDEVNFLNDKTASTWRSQANMQVEMSVQELQYTRQRMGEAQMEMLNAWNKEQKVANQLDPYIVQTASLDPTFRQRYDRALQLDAEQRVVDAYQTNQTRIEQLPKNVRDMANLDPDFDNMIHQYYNSIETTAGQLAISVPQLIELQGLTGEAQKDKYEEFQFNNIKQDPVVVAEAQEIAREEDQVREAQFYDIDQAFLETDPTAITTWHPSDSQILQAHSAGMNLNEYVEYMHQLAMGEAGDYSKLRKYTDDQLRASGLLDYSHFQDELQMAGYRKDLYLYDPDTRQFTLNPNVTNSAIPSTQQTFISKYTPRYLLEARHEYADMIHGLNEKNQAQVDNYNNNLMKRLSAYGRHYDEMVADINNERLYQGRDDLLYYDIGKIYEQNKLEFKPVSERLVDAPNVNVVSQNEATKRQLGQQVSVKEKYVLNDTQYRNVKLNLESKNLVDANQEQIAQAVSEVKSDSA